MLGCIQPMSSPMMKRMLGFLAAAWANAGDAAKSASPPAATTTGNRRLRVIPSSNCGIGTPVDLDEPHAIPRRSPYCSIRHIVTKEESENPNKLLTQLLQNFQTAAANQIAIRG